MQITGNQLLFLLQVLKDSLKGEMGYDYAYKYKREQRKAFQEELMHSILLQEKVDVLE